MTSAPLVLTLQTRGCASDGFLDDGNLFRRHCESQQLWRRCLEYFGLAAELVQQRFQILREMKDAQKTTLKDGRAANKGKCAVCGTTIMRMGA